MKKLPLNQHAFLNPAPTGIGAKNTISNGPDDGTLNLMTSHFAAPMRHGTTQQAIANGLNGPSNTGELNIGGHGNTGVFETGTGQNGPFDVNKWIATWTDYIWGPELDKIKPSTVTQISIWSCHTGEGQEGADLLFEMAQRCGRAVRAGTGFLYSNNQSTWWENGSVWQVATPTNKPAPIPAPSTHPLMLKGSIIFECNGEEYGISDVIEIRVGYRGNSRKTSLLKAFRGADVQSILKAIFFSPPVEIPEGISAMKTGSIQLIFRNDQALELTVLNDRLAVNFRTKTGYYIKPMLADLSTLAE